MYILRIFFGEEETTIALLLYPKRGFRLVLDKLEIVRGVNNLIYESQSEFIFQNKSVTKIVVVQLGIQQQFMRFFLYWCDSAADNDRRTPQETHRYAQFARF